MNNLKIIVIEDEKLPADDRRESINDCPENKNKKKNTTKSL
jgi:hypothetical protein